MTAATTPTAASDPTAESNPSDAEEPPAPLVMLRWTGPRHTPSTRPPAHRSFSDDESWRTIPGLRDIDAPTFLDWRWQAKHSVRDPAALGALLGPRVSKAFIDDVATGLELSPMQMRITPYVLSLIDWDDPVHDPIRRQFIPLGSQKLPDHPAAHLDALAERDHSVVPGLVHRYPDRALFVALDRCPVYCRYCTRSYAIGEDTETVHKNRLGSRALRWAPAFDYIRRTPALEDIVVSGGDSFMLRPEELSTIIDALAAIPHIRRIRIATKGIAVMPMKLLTDAAWMAALTRAQELCHGRGIELAIHTHVAHPRELTGITERVASELWNRGIKVRNQAVVLRGVNDDAETLVRLVRSLGWLHIEPYYLYQHDFIPGVEELRTSLHATLQLERAVRGATAGFNTPTFVVDLPGGGGKRDVHSYEKYDRATGVSTWRSPNVDQGARYLYFDPLHALDEDARRRWAAPGATSRMVARASRLAGSRRVADES